MGQPRIKWGQVERYLLNHGYTINSRGGDKIIVAPENDNGPRERQTLRIGHTSCSKAGDELLKVYQSKLKNLFGITTENILNG